MNCLYVVFRDVAVDGAFSAVALIFFIFLFSDSGLVLTYVVVTVVYTG